MDTVRWKQIEAIVNKALDLQPAEREALIERECGDDAELRREVESLIASDEEAQKAEVLGAIGKAAKDYAAERSGWVAEDLTGQLLGGYRVKRKIGEGGMSEVYLAIDTEGPVERKVAIKVLRGELRSASMLARFEAERVILAHLNHPGIARLYDAGSTPRSRPYVVMEFVEGVPVTRHCQERGLGITERVELVARIADAMQYAHNNLIVHRDIKPENVLVTPDGEPKLLDFGIAKMLADPSRQMDRTALTMTGMRLLTPRYASPEQLLGEPITVASDVYSLGLLLFELLTGQPPPDSPEPGQLPLASSVLEHEAANPLRRGWRTVRGDLDTIVQVATRREPARRYGSMEKFADDLRRFLRAEPVSARPDTITYRVVKFARRNRGRVIAGAAATLLLTGFVTVTLIQKRRAEARLAQVQQLASSVLTEVGAMSGVPGALRHRERLVEAVKQHLDTLAPEASDSARFLADLSAAYTRLAEVQGLDAQSHLGRRDEAVRVMESACRLARQALDRGFSGAGFAREAMNCEQRLSGALVDASRLAEAAQALDRAARLRASYGVAAAPPEKHTVDGVFASRRANLLRIRGDRKGAIKFFEESLAALVEADKAAGTQASRVAARAARLALASEYLAAGDAAAAVAEWEASMPGEAEGERWIGLSNYLEGAAQAHWNAINVSAGNIDRAEELERSAVEWARKWLAKDPLNATAATYLRTSLASLSYLLSHRGKREEAARHARQSVLLCNEAVKIAPESGSNWTARVRANLSLAVAVEGTPESAEALEQARASMRRIWEMRKRPRAGDDPSVSILMGRAASWRNAWPESERWFRQAVEDVKRGANAPEAMLPHVRGQAYVGLARALATQAKCAEAREWNAKAVAEYEGWTALPPRMKDSRFHRENLAAARGSAASCATSAQSSGTPSPR